MDLFKLVGKLSIEGVEESNKAIDGVTDKSEKAHGKLSGAFSKIGKGAAVVGKTIGTGLAVGGAAMGALTVKALNLGGELEQNMGGSEQVFKNYAGKMQETAKTAFSDMGLSTSDFLATANKMGALFQGAGFSIKESSDLSASAMQRAADVASIMGIDTSAAMEAVAGAAKGNFTMMDNLGVAMNDTTLNAYALEKGIGKTTQEMTNQEKIGLAMELFMEKTAYAAGNYANENETLAGSLGTAKSALTNFLDGSGDVESLVTSFSNVANVIVKSISEIAPRLVTGVVDIINQLVPQIPPLLQKLLPVIINGAVSLVQGLVAAIPTIVSALLEALPGLIAGVEQIFTGIVEALPQLLQTILSALPTLIPMLIDSIVNMIVTICNNFSTIIQPIIDYLPDIIISIIEALVNNLPALIQGIITLVMGIVEAIPQIIQGLVDAIPTIVSLIISAILNNLPAIIAGLIRVVWGIVKALPQIFASLIEGVVNTFKGIWDAIKNVFASLGAWFKKNVVQPIAERFEEVKSKVQEKITAVKNKVSEIFGNIKSKISSTVDNIKSKVTTTFEKIKDAMSKPIQKAKDLIQGIVDKIKGMFSKLNIKLPKIKMPHFGITPKGWKFGDLLKGEIPKLNIDWYAKAMNNPLLLNKPTIFGYDNATGNLLGGGEAGAEVVAGANTLMGMIQKAVAEQNSTLTYYMSRLLDVLAAYFPQILDAMNRPLCLDSGALVGGIAEDMDTALGKIRNRKDRGR